MFSKNPGTQEYNYVLQIPYLNMNCSIIDHGHKAMYNGVFLTDMNYKTLSL